MKKARKLYLGAIGLICLPLTAQADLVTWTDWTSVDGAGAVGSLGGIDVRVTTVSGSINGPSQTTCAGGTNWWTEPNAANPAYTGGSIDNAPTPCEQVALSSAVELMVTFSAPVDTLYMALLSVGQPGLAVTYDFDQPFAVDSNGIGFWSFANSNNPGSIILGPGDTATMNEVHGVLAFNNPVTTLTFTTSPNEYWHAFTFATEVPEPGTLLLLGAGLLGLGLTRRRRTV